MTTPPSSPAPHGKRLPVKPSQEHLRKQAKRLAKQRSLTLADAQHQLANEYGCRNWAELMHTVEVMNRGADQLTNALQKPEPLPLEVTPEILLVHRGDVAGLAAMIDENPDLVQNRFPAMPYGNISLASGTLLHCAAEFGEMAVAELLIQRGSPVNAATSTGDTPLHCAALNGPLELVELLLRHGSKEWMQNQQGKTPLDHARVGSAADKDAIIELLDRPVIRDPIFKQAVQAIHSGNLLALQQLLRAHPNLVHDRAIEPDCYPHDYFRDPKLLWFVAFNPTLVKMLPANILQITESLIAAGPARDDLNYTLGLVMTSSVAREQNFQRPLMKLLLDRGAIVTRDALHGTLGHGERDAVEALLESGLPITAAIAAGLGRIVELASLLPAASADEKHAALSMAVINRQLEAARLCLAAGADVNRVLLVHKHSLPVHQAAVNDDIPMLKLLIAHGAKLDIPDTLWNGTPLGWAIHTRKPAAEAYLRSINAP